MAHTSEPSEIVSERVDAHPDAQDSRERFATDLRALKLAGGDPTLLALESRTGISKSVLSEAFSGKRLPTEKTVRVLTSVLGADTEAWLARRQELLPRSLQSGATSTGEAPVAPAPRHRVRAGSLVAVTALVSVAASSLIWWGVLERREAFWTSQRAPLAGNQFLAAIDGVDPMQTECRQDRIIADVGPRLEAAVQVEMLYSNSCMGVWGRVTRLDGKADGNSLSMRIYPADDPDSERSQERSSDNVNSLYTPLLIEPDVEARVCGIATMTLDGEVIELSPPMCVILRPADVRVFRKSLPAPGRPPPGVFSCLAAVERSCSFGIHGCKEPTMSKSSIAWLLFVLGGAGLGVFLIKISIIGYYPNEFVPFLILGLASAALLWIGDRFRKAAAFEARSGGERDSE